MKNLKRYKIQLIMCAVMGVLAVAAALVSGLVCDERTALAIRTYFAVHPAAILAAIPLETLFLVSSAMMSETDPYTFFFCGAETSVIAAAACEIVIVTFNRQPQLIATIAMPYILLTLVAFAVCLAATKVRQKFS